MAAYVFVEIDVKDPELFAEYKKQTPATLEAFGGCFLVRGGDTRVLEGDWDPARLILLRFDSVEKAKAWWHSQAYSGPKALRQKAAVTNMVLMEGQT